MFAVTLKAHMDLLVSKEGWLVSHGNGGNPPNRSGGVDDFQGFRALCQIETVEFLIPNINEAKFILSCIVKGAFE